MINQIEIPQLPQNSTETQLMTPFNIWIDTFLSEKGIDTEDTVQAVGPSGTNDIPVGCLVDLMKTAPYSEQRTIREMLVCIDFRAPGRKPVLDYFAHLAQAVAL